MLRPAMSKSFFSRLTRPSQLPAGGSEASVDTIRDAMLAIAGTVPARYSGAVAGRILRARDVLDLWFVRSELMALIAHRHGEKAAIELLDGISAMFEGLLPGELRRVPPLARRG